MTTTPIKGQLYNVDEIRQQARQSVDRGAITEDYPLNREEVCQLLNEALASEILCVLRYRHHQIIAKGINYPQVAEEFAEHAENEHEHMMMLAERIDQLGGDPDFNPATIVNRSSTEYGSSGPEVQLTQLIKEDLVAERIAIEIYRKLINYFGHADPTSRRLIEEILEDEEEHANDLADLLATVDSRTPSAY
ncbi:MAG: ferritin-like domain-containing protein [Actinomycetota bacterium]